MPTPRHTFKHALAQQTYDDVIFYGEKEHKKLQKLTKSLPIAQLFDRAIAMGQFNLTIRVAAATAAAEVEAKLSVTLNDISETLAKGMVS
jgi:hypothetical protein